jgi:hypothetical protein
LGYPGEFGPVFSPWKFEEKPMNMEKLNQIKPNKSEDMKNRNVTAKNARNTKTPARAAILKQRSGMTPARYRPHTGDGPSPLRLSRGCCNRQSAVSSETITIIIP